VSPWILAARPKTLVAAAAPVAVGAAVAHAAGGFRPGPALAALLGAAFIQIGTNFANDVFDAEKGADGPDRLGPVRVVSAGLLSARAVRAGMALTFAAAFICGLYLTAVAGPVVVAIGIGSIAAGIAYTAGPFPLGYHGLGDVFVMIFFGFVAVCGTAFVQLGGVPSLALWASVPVGALATCLLVVNNLRDRETDARAGKRTLAVRLGRGGALAEYYLLVAAAYAVPVAIGGWAMLPLVTLPLAVPLCVQVARREGRPLNDTLAGTARLLLLHSLLFAVGLWLR
jgi:1,4-dihydroxy-2-naphthoate octaprenyltransferase